MSKKPIKSNLFRFVTLRSPQLIEDKETGFVSFPESKKAESLAFKAIESATTEEERKTALEGAFDTGFTPVAGRIELKNMHEALYVFSGWLMRNKTSLSYASIQSNLSGATALTLDQERVIWDNLFYQTIKKESVSVRERLIQLLVTNQFLKAFNLFTSGFNQETDGEIVFTEENEKEFIRRANASVIIPKDLLVVTRKELVKSEAAPSSDALKYMQADLEVALAKERAQQIEVSIKELEQAETAYKKAESVRYDAELKVYEDSIEQIKADATPEIQRIVKEDGFSRELKIYPELQLPEFEFVKGAEINRGADSTLSPQTLELLKSDELKSYETFGEVKNVLRDKAEQEYQLVYKKTPQASQKVSIGGTSVSIDPLKGAQLYSFSGLVAPALVVNKNSLSMSLNVGYTNAYVVSASYELKRKDGTSTLTNTQVEKLGENKNLLSLKFFPNGETLTRGEYVFSGELTLDNGIELTFSADMFVDVKLTTNIFLFNFAQVIGKYAGVAKLASSGGQDTGGDSAAEVATEDKNLYGVSQLGIADFRRVEQEVCCYVPGEVSHIENIMAREYKERSTRKLTSSERTTEKTTEREVENLTDTTSTERNELQNETSSIVNSDNATSFGANASVSGGFGKTTFNAGTNYNNASSNSTSNSNSQAQTYAQEVTERALERVVQKISTKRTSRILREFEENNTHGFDNRKGDKHVTGVYRWVDKIYKNKLINYGKRLMYEFALPEPAKFYIESYLKVDKPDTPKGLIFPKKPLHPSEIKSFGVKNASELNASNYLLLASEYNSEILTKPKEMIYVSESYKLDATKTVGAYESSSINDNIKIPEGYTSKEVTVSYSGVEDDRAASAKGFFINVGNITISDRENQPKLHKKVVRTMLNFTGDVAVSATQVDFFTGSINVAIECKLSDEGLKQWQNEAYKAIMDAYNERMQEYNEFIINQNIGEEPTEKKKELSSQINRGIEKRELKRIAIDLITKPFEVVASRDNYKKDGEKKDYRYVARTPEFQKHTEVVKFFEQAFDWEIMAYTFYPYFYGEDTSWDANFEYNEGSDPIFQAFLQSGMARSVVPVRPGFEEAVNWYMKTGEIWNGQGMVTDMDDDLYVSIAEEMQTIEGEVEGTWETRVPTTLTVLQADSVVLKEGGLPCNPDCEGQGLFDVSTYKIGDGPDGVDYDIVGDTNNVA
ncbi:conserved protein of unknown function [Tenacibaculum sp. 190130A14a]|uniref:Uncharacterized protein n=1 Tax=Tenacibaculum polynesiense TaxID=3137857 RepID=A0ABM9PAD2_9FLAO